MAFAHGWVAFEAAVRVAESLFGHIDTFRENRAGSIRAHIEDHGCWKKHLWVGRDIEV
jgi:hypothetical protein